MELHFGDWEGLRWDEIDRGALNVWGADYINLAPPNGESLLNLLARFKDFVSSLPSYETVIIVTHSGVIRCANHLFNNVPLNEIMTGKIDFGSVHRYQLE